MDLSPQQKNDLLIDIIKDGLFFYTRVGQILDGNIIKNIFMLNDIDLIITIGTNMYMVQINYDKNIIDKISIERFFNECLQMKNYLLNNNLNFFLILVTKNEVHELKNHPIIKNLYVHSDDLIIGLKNYNIFFEYLLLKIHHFIVETSGMNTGLKCYKNDDIIMEYYPK